ncbi:MAG: V/A-type H+-transporting ATPase subunit C [Candidatus Nanohaloarchaea archaeon]|jgi:V/A-type H+-transporting ATPase subunit C
MRLSTDYPYMYSRVSAKKAKLLDEKDYEKLVKMSPSEIARNLEEGEYKKEIDELGSQYDGVRLVELALARNLANTFSHLSDIAPETLEQTMTTFLRRYDILSLKRLLRAKKTDSKEDVLSLLTPVTGYTLQELEELSTKSFDHIKDNIEFENSGINYQKYVEDKEELHEIEKALDQAYFDEMNLLASKIRNKHLKKFISEEMEYENLKIALRLKKYGVDEEEIRENLLKNGKSRVVEEVINSKNLEEALEKVEEELDIRFEEENGLEQAEHQLEVARLENATKTLHREPLGITSIIGYIVAKTIEVRNLRMLIRAKETGIQNQETIKNNLVIA